jgi:cytochrome c oxidase subunit III
MTTIDNEYPIPRNGRPYHERYRPAVHFRSREHEFSTVKLGMWLFLTTEVLLFGGMFCAYAVFRMLYPQAFANGSHYLDWRWGSLNTVILLISSFTVAMSIHNAQKNQQFWLRINLSITILCALAFIVIKLAFEYIPKWSEGKRPGSLFQYAYAADPYEHIWWSVYYVSTGIHALHVVIGACVLGWVLWRAMRLHFGPGHYNAVEVSGLYWHLVDMIWIFLFPLLYLIH